MASSSCSTRPVAWRLLALVAIALALVLGTGRLLQQHDQPPAWVKAQLFEGYVAIDGHAERAALARDWLLGRDPEAVALLQFLRRDEHPTTVTIPLATAALACTGLPIPWSYFAVVVALCLATLHLVGRLAQALAEPGRDPYWLAVAYLALHTTALRTVGQLLLDWGVAWAAVAAVLGAVRFARIGSIAGFALATVAMAFAVFTKSSSVAVCALPVLIVLVVRGRAGLQAALALLAPALLVTAAAWGYAQAVAHTGLFERDAAQHAGTRMRPLEFGIEMVLLGQLAPLLAWRARPWPRPAVAVALATLWLCATVWVFRLPATPRLYLPALALGVACCSARISLLAQPRWFGAFALANVGVTVAVFVRG